MAKSIQTQIWNAFTLNADFYGWIPDNRATRQFSRRIVSLAALSYSVGNIVIFGMNRATPVEMALGFGVSIALFVGIYYFWTFTINGLLHLLTSQSLSYRVLLNLVGFAYTPQLLAIFTLIPLLGRPIELMLNAWSLLAIIIAVRHRLNIQLPLTILICLPGWVLSNIIIGIIQVLEQ